MGKFRNEKIAVHCKTEDEAKDFCQKMHEQGIKWGGGQSYLDITYYNKHKEETCYSGSGCYCPYDYYKEKGYAILEWSDYMRKEFTKSDLKSGMVVEYRNGERRIVIDNMLIGKSGFLTLNQFSENLKDNEQAEAIDIMKIYIILKARKFESVLNDNNLELIWDREETKRMTVEEMRQKLEELTGEKIEYEPSRGEMIGACYEFCRIQNCSGCVLSQFGNCCFKNYSDEKLKQCYEKVMEDGRN